MNRTILKETDCPLKKAIIEKEGTVSDFAYINGIDKSSLYKMFKRDTKYLHEDMILNIAYGLEIPESEVLQLCKSS